MYLYPFRERKSDALLTSKNISVHPRLKPLYAYLSQNNRIVDLEEYDPEYLEIFSREVLKMIKDGNADWQELVPGNNS